MAKPPPTTNTIPVERLQLKQKILNKDPCTRTYLFSKCDGNDASKTQDP
jgi:hypothetical protein